MWELASDRQVDEQHKPVTARQWHRAQIYFCVALQAAQIPGGLWILPALLLSAATA
jgi:hypothetical protein